MSAAAARPIRLGLTGAAAVAMTAGALALAAPAASAEGCTWQRHSKPVVKQVRRHGQLRRVKRLKHWWTCDAAPVAPTSNPTPPALQTGASLPVEEPKSSLSHLGVKAVEYSYTLSRPEVAAGETIVELDNQGEDAHNLKIQREGSGEPPLDVPEAAAGEQTTARFTLEPGTYHLYCSLFHHDEKGMHATLVVTPTS
jgi:plastocyanin